MCFFFSSRRRHTRWNCDWSSDVCSSDLLILDAVGKPTFEEGLRCLAPFGHLVLYGRAGGAPDPVNLSVLSPKSQKRSEERRVGKECSVWSWPYHEDKGSGASNRRSEDFL